MYAIIQAGGKQYRVAKGDILQVERLEAEPEATVEFPVLFARASEDKCLIGTPHVAGAKVVATVLGEDRDKKIIIFKKKKRKQYRRTKGHRQYFTEIEVSDIVFGA